MDLTAIPHPFTGLVTSFHSMVRKLGGNGRFLMGGRATTCEEKIVDIWGGSLSKMQALNILAGKRMQLAHAEMDEVCQERDTNIYDLMLIGYRCVQTCCAVQILCAEGLPDQGLPLCRSLMEQEANIGFISTIENKEEVVQRFLDWERAKLYREIKKRKEKWDGRNMGPSDESWAVLTREYEQIKAKYDKKGDLCNLNGWAIGTRSNGTKPATALSVRERARQSIPRLVGDETRLHDDWTWRWQRLNEFTHTTPRSISESASSLNRDVIVIGRTVIGLDEPLMIAGISILNISSQLTDVVVSHLGIDRSRRSEELGKETLEAFRELLNELKKVPATFAPWWHSGA